MWYDVLCIILHSQQFSWWVRAYYAACATDCQASTDWKIVRLRGIYHADVDASLTVALLIFPRQRVTKLWPPAFVTKVWPPAFAILKPSSRGVYPATKNIMEILNPLRSYSPLL